MSNQQIPPLNLALDQGAMDLVLQGLGELPTKVAGPLFTNLFAAWQQHVQQHNNPAPAAPANDAAEPAKEVKAPVAAKAGKKAPAKS